MSVGDVYDFNCVGETICKRTYPLTFPRCYWIYVQESKLHLVSLYVHFKCLHMVDLFIYLFFFLKQNK